MKLDWKRVVRTLMQSAAGAAAAFVTAISADFSKESLITASIQFGCTVVIAVLMNIQKQAGDNNVE